MAFKLSFDYNVPTTPATQFTENFFVNTALLATAIDRADKMAVLLAKMHGAQTSLVSCSISDTEILRAGTIRYYDDVPSIESANDTDSDYPTTALQLHLYAASGKHTMQWLKGLPDGCVQKARKKLTDGFIRAFAEFKTYVELNTNLMVLQMRDPAGDKWRIDGLTTAGEVTLPVNDLREGEIIDIVGRGIPKYFRKEWQLIKVDDLHFKLYGAVTQPDFSPGFKGVLRRIGFIYPSIKEAKIGKATEHDVHKEKK